MVRSPSAAVSTTARMERPISRWISCVLPDGRPFVTSRGVRLAVARGSMEYSAVTHPLPELRRNGGTVSSTVAAHSTCVLPTLISADPSAVTSGSVTISTGRISAAARLSVRILSHGVIENEHHQEHGENQDNDARQTTLRARGAPGFPLCRLELRH